MRTPPRLSDWIDKQVDIERNKKLRLLLRHYEIEDQTAGSWIELAKCLAIEFVDVFKLVEDAPKRRGKPGRWTEAEGAQLVLEVGALKESMNLSTSQVLDEIRALSPERYAKMEKRSLRKRYDEARKRFGEQ